MTTPIPINQTEVDAIVVALLRRLAEMEARAPEAYVALMLVASALMLNLDALPDAKMLNVVLMRLLPVWEQLLAEQAGHPVH